MEWAVVFVEGGALALPVEIVVQVEGIEPSVSIRLSGRSTVECSLQPRLFVHIGMILPLP